jgi:uncharacterized membrane protein
MNTQLTVSATDLTRKNTYRVESIDLLRGLIMVIMALDHIRDYFHAGAFQYSPTDLTKTNTILFFTRWITHFCAPVFMLLSGTSAYLVGKRKGKKELSRFLLTRGLWLILLEFTIIKFGWSFNINYSMIFVIVIWALGISMIILAGLIQLPLKWILVIGLVLAFGHNLLDPLRVAGNGAGAVLWSFLHQPNFLSFNSFNVFVAYPIIPWCGVMALGYCLGKLYEKEVDAAKRKKWLLQMGIAAIVLFIVLRYINVYGDPSRWAQQSSGRFTFLSFLNTSKYPPSLLYLLMTLGPSLVFLALTENSRSWFADQIKVIGRVPFFYYLAHIYLFHLVALFATYFCGFHPGDMILNSFVTNEPQLQGYGFSLGVTYAVWIGNVLLLYLLCRWYDKYKRTHTHWWLSYL